MNPRAAVAATLVVLALAVGCSGTGPDLAAATSEFWSDPTSAAVRQAGLWRQDGRADDAAQMDRIARRPAAVWLTGGDPAPRTRDVVARAAAAGRTAVLVAYDIPGRDCGQYSAGGASSDDDYRTWTARLASALSGARRPVVILEPDALAQALTSCGDRRVQARRERLLSDATDTLASAGAEVYVDAGNPGFVSDTARLADALRRSGVARAAGFALNVANFHATEEVTAYGRSISDRLGGARFVIDTGRNGNGSYRGPEQPTWCNPPGRALGTPRPGTPRTRGWRRTCGSRSRAVRTAPAAAPRGRARSCPSTPWTWPAPPPVREDVAVGVHRWHTLGCAPWDP